MRDVALLVEEDAAFLAVDVLEADALARSGVGIAALRENALFAGDVDFEFNFAVEDVDEGFFVFLGAVGVVRVRRGAQGADQLHEARADLRRAENRHLGVNDSGNRIDHAALGGNDRKVRLDD